MSDHPVDAPAIEARKLSRAYRGAIAVRDLDLHVSRGEIFGLIGTNGAGKSTTIKMLMGMVEPTSGHAQVLGRHVIADRDVIRSSVGYVPERSSIYGWMTVAQVVRFVGSFYPTWNERLCAELLVRFGLDTGKKVSHLSHGGIVKLALLLAIAHEPDLLLLDEPTSGLDPIAREEFLEGLATYTTDHRRTILFSSHNIADVEHIATLVGIIHNGTLIRTFDPVIMLGETRLIRLSLPVGLAATMMPEGTIWHRVQGRELQVVVSPFSDRVVGELRGLYPCEDLTVSRVGLEDLLKYTIRGLADDQ